MDKNLAIVFREARENKWFMILIVLPLYIFTTLPMQICQNHGQNSILFQLHQERDGRNACVLLLKCRLSPATYSHAHAPANPAGKY